MSEITEKLIATLQALQPEKDGDVVDYVSTDELGEHYVLHVGDEDPPLGVWFYIDEANKKIVVEAIGAKNDQ